MSATRRHRPRIGLGVAALLAALSAPAHTPVVDGDLADWCLGAPSNGFAAGGRIEDSGTVLVCGRCSITPRVCRMADDCPVAESCVDLGSRVETVWWDNRTDAAVNDLATVATTQDDDNLYFALQLWDYPDPVSLPFFEIAIDSRAGGIGSWHDPQGALTNAGHCSVDTDRGCTSDADCFFCTLSTEAPPSMRPRSCGSGCNPDLPQDVCDTTQICVDLGSQGPIPGVGTDALPSSLPDYLIVIDTSRWLVGLGDSIQLLADMGGVWNAIGVFGFPTNPGASGLPGGPAAPVEFSIPWSAFGCTGCPASCECPDFGPGQEFRLTAMIARANFTLDYAPDGAIEDVQSEAIAGNTTTTTDGCPGVGTATTACELADGSQDAFVEVSGPPAPGGRAGELILGKAVSPAITLDWGPSCSAADVDYAVYVGTIGGYYDHAPLPACTTGGATGLTLDPASGDRYYLVVPTDQSSEGSYGERSNGAERPTGLPACLGQSLAACP